MTEQCVSRKTTQEDARKCNRETAKHERDYHSDAENVEERHKYERMVSESLQAVDPNLQELSGRRKPALVRSKTFDHSLLTQVQTESDSKIERKKSHYSQLSKSNCQYHKIFKEISKEEQLRQSYTCALQKDILYQGRMFVSDHWICFHSKIAIPVMSVTHIKKTKTAILVPNALVIATANDRYVFVSLLSRDNTYKLLMSVCLHLEEKSPCSSPIPSSAENSFRGQRSPLLPRFPLSFPGDFSDLDGAVRQRRQEMEESSSSDSQTPDYEKISEFPVPQFLDVLKHTDSAAPPERPDHQHKERVQHQNQQSSEDKQHSTLQTGSELVIDSRTLKPVSLNTLLFVYLFLHYAAAFPEGFLNPLVYVGPLPSFCLLILNQTQNNNTTANEMEDYCNVAVGVYLSFQHFCDASATNSAIYSCNHAFINTLLHSFTCLCLIVCVCVCFLRVCVLVLSSCYLAFKITSLEQRLTKLGSVTEFNHQENDFLRVSDVNTELFSELLTINLMKLEKVQKNLQRLLDEAA